MRTLLIAALSLLVGCAASQGEGRCPFDLWGAHETPEAVAVVTLWLAPVAADLDYQSTVWGREQAIVEGGYQHVLSVPGEALPVSAMKSPAPLATETVHFASGSDFLDALAREKLSALVNGLPVGELHVEVEGHTDAVGNLSYNQGLSLRRADAVKAFLAGLGIAPGHIETTGHGETLPIDTNQTAEGRAANRRATVRSKGEVK